MNEIIESEKLNIEDMIYEVRGKQVMLDSDLAKLYQVETKRINEAVKNNQLKFPERFSWILTNEEWVVLRSKFSTLKEKHAGKGMHRKYLPRVFTEQGVAMLATILKSDVAVKVSIRIMDAFVVIHKYISNNYIDQIYVGNMLLKHDKDIKLLQESFDKLAKKKITNEIYFKGQIYDAYSKIVDILSSAKSNIIIIDGYSDKTTLDIISKTNVKVVLVTKKKANIKRIDIIKYNEQYSNLQVIYDDTFHDRYIIIDNSFVYHLGASINHVGSKTFSINILEDKLVKDALVNNVASIINV